MVLTGIKNQESVKMFFREETKALLQKSIGITLEELAQMDYDEEIAFVEKKIGRPLEFPLGIDLRKPQPRNILLSRGCFLINKKPRIRFRLLRKLLSALRLIAFKPKLN